MCGEAFPPTQSSSSSIFYKKELRIYIHEIKMDILFNPDFITYPRKFSLSL